ncbi:unnamed protein product, partial [Meganyctiphanes norvegica]
MRVNYISELRILSGIVFLSDLKFLCTHSIYICSLYNYLCYSYLKKYIFQFNYCSSFDPLPPPPNVFVLGSLFKFVNILVWCRCWSPDNVLSFQEKKSLFKSDALGGQEAAKKTLLKKILKVLSTIYNMPTALIVSKIKVRLPYLSYIGFMTASEKKIFDDLEEKTTHPKYFIPLVWAGSIVARARKEGRIRDDFAVKTIVDEINRFRSLCGGLLSYDWISIPLVYTQVVTLAVYTFFLGTIMGRQFLDPTLDAKQLDIYVPIFTFLQFFFYMGWLKVAESLVNPFGEDDDDFEVNWLVDRNLQVSYLIVDEMHSEHPDLVQDIYWDEVFPAELPYTIASEQFRREPPQGSTANLEVADEDMEFLPMLEEENEEVMSRNLSGIQNDTTSLKSKTSQYSISRKPSMLSMFLKKVTSKTSDVGMPNKSRVHGSSLSIRRSMAASRNKRESASRISRMSSMTSVSPASIGRVQTTASNCDSNIFRMSDSSLDMLGEVSPDADMCNSPRSKGRNSGDESDEPMYINIKKRDKDGRVILGDDDIDSRSNRSKSSKKHYKREKRVSLWTDNIPPGERSDGSDCSIRTSIFTGEDDEAYKKTQTDINKDAQIPGRIRRGCEGQTPLLIVFDVTLTPTTLPRCKDMRGRNPDDNYSEIITIT